MKKITNPQALVIVLLLVVTAVNSVSAAPVLRSKSKYIITRTTAVLTAAQAELKSGQVFTGNFAQAIAHQKHANKLYDCGMYQQAIQHSRRARILALSVINMNKGVMKAEYDFDQTELSAMKTIVHDEELDKKLQLETYVSGKRDEDFLDFVVDDIDLAILE